MLLFAMLLVKTSQNDLYLVVILKYEKILSLLTLQLTVLSYNF